MPEPPAVPAAELLDKSRLLVAEWRGAAAPLKASFSDGEDEIDAIRRAARASDTLAQELIDALGDHLDEPGLRSGLHATIRVGVLPGYSRARTSWSA